MNEYKVVVSKQVEEFLLEIEESARTKFIKAFSKVELGLRGVHFLKLSGTNNIFEFRVQDSGKWYRILAYSKLRKKKLTKRSELKKKNNNLWYVIYYY
jgi:hypothetical protein